MRTSPNIWLVFDGLRERTRKVPAERSRGGGSRQKERNEEVRNGKEGKKIRKERGWRRWRRVLRSTNGAAEES